VGREQDASARLPAFYLPHQVQRLHLAAQAEPLERAGPLEAEEHHRQQRGSRNDHQRGAPEKSQRAHHADRSDDEAGRRQRELERGVRVGELLVVRLHPHIAEGPAYVVLRLRLPRRAGEPPHGGELGDVSEGPLRIEMFVQPHTLLALLAYPMLTRNIVPLGVDA